MVLETKTIWSRRTRLSRGRLGCFLAVGWLLTGWAIAQTGDSSAAGKPGEDVRRMPPEVSRFDDWMRRWRAGEGLSEPALEAEGIRLVEERRTVLGRLIREDPRTAIGAAVPEAVRAELPPAIVSRLAEPLSGRGFWGVLCTLGGGENEHSHAGTALTRHVVLEGRRYEAYVYGARLNMQTRESVWLHGVALDGLMAVAEDPVRRLTLEEIAAPGAGRTRPSVCRVCGQPLTPGDEALWGDLGGETLGVCSERDWLILNQQVLAEDGVGSPLGGEAPIADSAWTEGLKRVLLIRVDFGDLPGEPVSELAALDLLTGRASAFFEENSYGKTRLEGTVTPVFRMPESSAYYVQNDADVELLEDARRAARAGGYDPALYDLDIAGFKTIFSGWAGKGYVGGKGLWINGYFDDRVTFHELGHNYGLWHANAWNATGDTVIGPGTAEEYGDTFDTMGRNGGATLHFGSWYKSLLGWLSPDESTTVTRSGTYRVFAHDTTVGTGLSRYLRIPNPRDTSHDYCVEFRQKVTSNRWLMNGVKLNWILENNSSLGSRLLDTTPGTADDRNDHPIVIGRTFADPAAGIYITPIGKAGTVPEAVDVVVNVGTFPDNQPPTLDIATSSVQPLPGEPITLAATAADADGDLLAYTWDFGDRNFGPNQAEVTKSWPAAGQYAVRCEVSDMRGGTVSRAVLVTVGNPARSVIRGEVRNEAGDPVSGVRIFNGLGIRDSAYRTTWTDSSGAYWLANLTSGTYTLAALRPGYELTPSSFANPVTVGPDVSGADFVAQVIGATLSGRVTEGGVGVTGVVVSDGDRSALTDANGDYLLGPVPWGTYRLTADKPGYGFVVSGFTNPVMVEGEDLSGLNFVNSGPTYALSGEINGVNDNAPLVVTDGYRQTTARKLGKRHVFTLEAVPAGVWHLRVVSATASYAPENFSNPLVVDSARSGLTFARQSTHTFAISGAIYDAQGEVSAVEVQVGSQTGLTDSRGEFYVGGFTDGDYGVSPRDAERAFEPPARTVTVAGTDVTGVDFSVLPPAPPVVNLAVSTEAFSEGDAQPLLVTLSRSGDSGQALVVQLQVRGTALAGYDYEPLPETLNFPEGESQVILPVVALDDQSSECDKTLIFELLPGPTYEAGDVGSLAVTLIDDDLPTIDLVAQGTWWSEDSDLPIEVTLARSGCLASELAVNLRWSGSAEPGLDYTGELETVWFAAGEALKILPIKAVVDQDVEGLETLVVEVLPGGLYLPGVLNRVDGHVRDAAVDEWRLAMFGQEALDPDRAGDSADPDGDRFSNLAEFVYGMDPLAPDVAGGPQITADSGLVTLSFPRRRDLGRVQVTLEHAEDLLGEWVAVSDLEVVSENGEVDILQWVAPDPVSGRSYFRVWVSR